TSRLAPLRPRPLGPRTHSCSGYWHLHNNTLTPNYLSNPDSAPAATSTLSRDDALPIVMRASPCAAGAAIVRGTDDPSSATSGRVSCKALVDTLASPTLLRMASPCCHAWAVARGGDNAAAAMPSAQCSTWRRPLNRGER